MHNRDNHQPFFFNNEEYAVWETTDQCPADFPVNRCEGARILANRRHRRFHRFEELVTETNSLALVPFHRVGKFLLRHGPHNQLPRCHCRTNRRSSSAQSSFNHFPWRTRGRTFVVIFEARVELLPLGIGQGNAFGGNDDAIPNVLDERNTLVHAQCQNIRHRYLLRHNKSVRLRSAHRNTSARFRLAGAALGI